MTIELGKTLIHEVHGGGLSVKCGPKLQYRACPKWIDDGYSNFVWNVPHIIPDSGYHPEIAVAIDFAHQFVLGTKDERIQGRRPLDPQIMRNAARRLASYVHYYFQYVLTYGKSYRTDIRHYDFDTGEDEIVEFLNTLFNHFLTNISVERSRTGIGTATVVFKDNPNYRYGQKTNIFLNKQADILNQLFPPMLPITIWGKGRLYKDWYFPIFDGYIISMTPSDSQGFSAITLACKDTLELARTSYEMVNPAIIQIKEFDKQTNVNIFAQPLYNIDHMQIFNGMFHGGHVVYVGDSRKLLLPGDEELKKYNPIEEGEPKNNDYLSFSGLGKFGYSDEKSLTRPWELEEDKVIHRDDFGIKEIVKRVSHVKRPRFTASWGSEITPYRILQFQSPNVFTSEFSSRLDIIRNVAGMVYYDLYVDGYGNVHYHPMRLANNYLLFDIIHDTSVGFDIKKAVQETAHQSIFPGVQIIGPEETINNSANLNLEELTTFLRVSGVHATLGDKTQSELLELVGSHVDERLMARFGYRRKELKNPLFNYNPKLKDSNGRTFMFMDLVAKSLIRFANAELYSRTATIFFRPEFDLAMPVLFTDNNEVFYVQSISHSVTIGGDATTTINANMGRKDYQRPPDLLSYILAQEKMYRVSGQYWTMLGDVISEDNLIAIQKEAQDAWHAPMDGWDKAFLSEGNASDEYAAKMEDLYSDAPYNSKTGKEIIEDRKKKDKQKLESTKESRIAKEHEKALKQESREELSGMKDRFRGSGFEF